MIAQLAAQRVATDLASERAFAERERGVVLGMRLLQLAERAAPPRALVLRRPAHLLRLPRHRPPHLLLVNLAARRNLYLLVLRAADGLVHLRDSD